MEHQRAMENRQRLEYEARKRLEVKGTKDPRTGGMCDFDEVRRYDIELEHVIFQMTAGIIS